MLIKQVSRRTGLSERTIRYYEQEGLVRPAQTERNGRTWREYSPEDVDAFLRIARLRRAHFSIPEIREMSESPDRIPAVVAGALRRISEETMAKDLVRQALERLDATRIPDVAGLAASLEVPTRRERLPERDVRPDFGRDDRVTEEERETAYREHLAHEARRERIGWLLVLAMAASNVLVTVVEGILAFEPIVLYQIAVAVLLSVLLFRGSKWARRMFLLNGLNYVLLLYLLIGKLGSLDDVPLPSLAVAVAGLLLGIASAVLLLTNAAVEEFFYVRKYGSDPAPRRPRKPPKPPKPAAAPRCPACRSEDLRVEPVGDGIGARAMGVESVGRTGVPTGGFGGGYAAPVPAQRIDAAGVLGGGLRVTCEACGHMLWAKDRNDLRRRCR